MDSDSSGVLTFATATTGATVAADDLVIILRPMVDKCLFDDTYTGIKSECDDNLWTSPIMGIATYIEAPGIPYQILSRALHDGLTIANARFYHEFTFCGALDENAATLPNAWMGVNNG